MQKTCIVIPCYNEASRLEWKIFSDYAGEHPNVHFLFVNDGSSDATGEILAAMSEKNKGQFACINRAYNLGKAQSVREGVLYSLSWREFDYIGYFDADLATPLEEIDWLLNHLQEDPDIVLAFGSRRKTRKNMIERNALRHNLGRLYAGFITGLLSLDIYDTQCGAKIFKTSTAKQIFQSPFIDRWLFDVEIFCRIKKMTGKKARAVIKEVVLRRWEEKGHSRIRKIDILKLPVKTVRIFFKYL